MLPQRGAARLLGHSARPSVVPQTAALRPHHGLPTAVLRPALAPNASSRRTFISLPPIIEPLANTFASIHSSTGLPWYILIPSVALVHTALISIPLRPREQTLAARRMRVGPLLTAWFTKTRSLGVSNPTEAAEKEVKRIQRDLGLTTLRIISPRLLIYFPTWFMLGNSIRHLAASGDPSLTTGGCLWFQDLAAPDPYYIIPTLMGSVLIYSNFPKNMDAVREIFDPKNSSMQVRVRRAVMVATPVIVYLIRDSPAGALLFWFTSIASSRMVARYSTRFLPPVSRNPWVNNSKAEPWFIDGPK